MTIEATPRWELPQLFAGQAQKEMFHNEALTRIDMLLHGQVESADLSVPPTSPAQGQCWIVAADAVGAWAGRDGALASWTEGGWRFVTPAAGLALWVADRGHELRHDGSQWQDGALREDGLYVAGTRSVGERQAAIAAPGGGTTIDSEARGVINAILAVMRSHGLIAS